LVADAILRFISNLFFCAHLSTRIIFVIPQ
jgi:hypothetical protein